MNGDSEPYYYYYYYYSYYYYYYFGSSHPHDYYCYYCPPIYSTDTAKIIIHIIKVDGCGCGDHWVVGEKRGQEGGKALLDLGSHLNKTTIHHHPSYIIIIIHHHHCCH